MTVVSFYFWMIEAEEKYVLPVSCFALSLNNKTGDNWMI